jgi:hypothetical protein
MASRFLGFALSYRGLFTNASGKVWGKLNGKELMTEKWKHPKIGLPG